MKKRLGLLCAVTLAVALGAQAAEYEVSVRRSPEARSAIITNDTTGGGSFSVIGLLPGQYSVCVKSGPSQRNLNLLTGASSAVRNVQLKPGPEGSGRACAPADVDETGVLAGRIQETRVVSD